MVLAAGRGSRMRPLTDHQPKPLLEVLGRPLIAWHLDALAAAGVSHCLINTAWLGEQLPQRLGRCHQGMALTYSMEGDDFGHALETAGGIARALPHLDEVFWVVAGDVFMPGFRFERRACELLQASEALAHIWLVDNPEHHPGGDFGLSAEGLAQDLPPDAPGARLTYSTVGVYRKALFAPPQLELPPGNPNGAVLPLGPLLRQAMRQGLVSASHYRGAWTDVGTPERLAALQVAHGGAACSDRTA